MTDKTELKPCPFCGGKDFERLHETIFSGAHRYFYVCNDCLARSPVVDDGKELKIKWNTRTYGELK